MNIYILIQFTKSYDHSIIIKIKEDKSSKRTKNIFIEVLNKFGLEKLFILFDGVESYNFNIASIYNIGRADNIEDNMQIISSNWQ